MKFLATPLPLEGAKYCNEYVSLSVHLYISKNAKSIFTNFCASSVAVAPSSNRVAISKHDIISMKFARWRHQLDVRQHSVWSSS